MACNTQSVFWSESARRREDRESRLKIIMRVLNHATGFIIKYISNSLETFDLETLLHFSNLACTVSKAIELIKRECRHEIQLYRML